ncbi:MAG: decarboxylase [Rhodospirillales bacterium]|nr:decarboxylase [Rhodospirillales bacterium]
MSDNQGQTEVKDHWIRGSSIIAAVKDAGVGIIITVPDITTSESLLKPISADPDLRHISVCKEDEAIGIAAGLSYCDARALILIQNTGFFDSINAIRAVGVEYGMPICLMVGLLGKEPDAAMADSKSYGVRIIEPILGAMGIGHHLLETEADTGAIAPAIEDAYDAMRPTALLIGRRPLAE